MTSIQKIWKMGGHKRAMSKRSFFLASSPCVLLSLSLLFVYLFSLASSVSLADAAGEVVEPVSQPGMEEDDDKGPDADSSNSGGIVSRVKRSRDTQQLCGYRLLDALRNVCDRNFVGFTRRSDPSFLGTFPNNGDSQSMEDIFVGGGNMSPWDLALLTMEYPHSSSSSGGTDVFISPSRDRDQAVLNRDGNAIIDYLEMLPQQPPKGGRIASSSSSKAFALKTLSEPPRTHQRFRRNIIDECCKKPCAMTQMLKYCAMAKRGF